MKIVTLLLSLFLFTGVLQAQDKSAKTISVNASASVSLPADRIAFNININAEADTPQKAYELHKKREQVLLELLKKHDIKEENIDFEPVSISRINAHKKDQKDQIRTSQSVTLSFSEFKTYEEIQVSLIENDYDNFSGHFMTSKTESGKDQALKKALKTAREKARIIAEESGLTLTGIQSIHFSYNQSPPRPLAAMADYAKAESSLVSEYEQSVNVSAQISVNYGFAAE